MNLRLGPQGWRRTWSPRYVPSENLAQLRLCGLRKRHHATGKNDGVTHTQVLIPEFKAWARTSPRGAYLPRRPDTRTRGIRSRPPGPHEILRRWLRSGTF